MAWKRLELVRDRWRMANALPRTYRRLGWTGAKLLGMYALSEAVRRARAGPLRLRVSAPLRASVGEDVLVEARVESPFPLAECAAYFGGAWRSAPVGAGATVRREAWWFRAAEPGVRPVVVRIRDAEGHAITRTRWVAVLPARVGGAIPGVRRIEPPKAVVADAQHP